MSVPLLLKNCYVENDLLHCVLASCGAVYCNRSCLWVCDSGRAGGVRTLLLPARAVFAFVSLSAFFVYLCCVVSALLKQSYFSSLDACLEVFANEHVLFSNNNRNIK